MQAIHMPLVGLYVRQFEEGLADEDDEVEKEVV